MQDTGALIEGPKTYLSNIIALYLFLKNRYWSGGGLGRGVEKKLENQFQKITRKRNTSVKIQQLVLSEIHSEPDLN